MTRARKLVIVVGDQKAIGLSVKQVKDQERYTLLAHRLKR
jgi:exodeoxyribonuclease V alpha subunit